MLAGKTLELVSQLDSARFLIRFAQPPFHRLHIAIHPRLSTAHLMRGVKVPSEPTDLGVALTEHLGGRGVERVKALLPDRILKIEFSGGLALVAELMGRASNLLLLDETDRILRLARDPQGDPRGLLPGETYRAPARARRWVVPDQGDLSHEAFESLLAASGTQAEEGLLTGLPGLSPHIAREILHRRGLGDDPWRAFQELRGRLEAATLQPVLYAPRPLEDLEASHLLTARTLFAFVFPLAHATGLTEIPYRTINEAEEAATGCLLTHLAHARLVQSLASMLAKERRRAGDLAETLTAELAEAERAEELHRRYGELILAGLATGRREGNTLRVTDHYDPEGKEIDVPLDGRLGLAENAQRYFKSARRGQRALRMIPARLAALETRRAALDAAAADLALARDPEGLAQLERGWQSAGLLKAFRKTQRADVGKPAEYVEVREFHTKEGFTILVGKSAAENDHLTFSVGAPHDLWLHASGWPGAHVIVRNPGRLGSLPDETILQAAAIAAYFSRGRTEKALDVDVAWRRHVRKGRGMSPGMVMLKKHRTVRVAPGLPPARSGSTRGV